MPDLYGTASSFEWPVAQQNHYEYEIGQIGFDTSFVPPPPGIFFGRSHQAPILVLEEGEGMGADLPLLQPQIPPPPPPPTGYAHASGPFHPPPPPKQVISTVHCDTCDKDFRTPKLLDLHVEEEHVNCDFAGCHWSGLPTLLLIHRVSHITDPNGISITESPTETQLWVEARLRARKLMRERRIRNEVNGVGEDLEGLDQSEELSSPAVSALETYYRNIILGGKPGTCSPGSRQNAWWIKRKQGMGLVPHVGKYLKAFESKRQEALGLRTAGLSSDRKVKIGEEFPICRMFFRTRSCRYGTSCKQSHDVVAYQRWNLARVKSGHDLRQRAINNSSLFHELLYPEIVHEEKLLLDCLDVLVANNFWQIDLDDSTSCTNLT